MITPSYSVTATERVLPKLALDFTTGVLDSRITVTRALNTATRINSSGLLEVVNANLPRFDYDYTTQFPRGLLIEETRINLITQSRDYSTVAWGKTAINVTACPDPSPTGATDAQTLTNSGGTGLLTFVHTGTSGVAYTFSTWLRRRSGTGNVAMTDANGNYIQLTLTSSWKRFTVVTTSSSSTTIRAYIRVYTSGDEVDVYNSQLELGSFATSDIVTAGSTVTRNADAVSMTGTNFSDWYNATEGTFAARGTRFATGLVTNILGVSDGTSTNRIRLYQETNNRMTINTSVLGSTTTGNGGATYGVAAAYSSGGVGVSCNGGTVAVSAAGAVPTGITSMDIGRNSPAATVTLNGWLQSIRYWPQRLTNAELQAFSK